MTQRRLRVVDGRYQQFVTLPRTQIVDAAMDAEALAGDLERALNAIEQRMWAGSRAGAVNEIGRARVRIDELRQSFRALAGLADRAPSDPTDAAVVAA